MLRKRRVITDRGPAAIGPYSQAIVAGEFVFVSGQIALDPATGGMVGIDTASQTEQVIKNLRGILEAAGSSLSQVVRAGVFLADLKEFDAFNRVYGEAFGNDPPARATVQAAALPRGALVEIEVVALKEA